MEKDLKTIQLFDEDGNEINLNVIAFFDMVNPETEEKSEYVIVQEVGYEDENPFALKVVKDEDNEDMFELIDISNYYCFNITCLFSFVKQFYSFIA